MNIIKSDIVELNIWQLKELMEKGDTDSLSERDRTYIKWMEKSRDLYYQNKTEKYVVRMLQSTVEVESKIKLSEWQAKKIFSDALNFFYINDTVRREAWRNVLFEKYMNLAAMAFDAREWELARNLYKDAERMKKLNDTDKTNIDPRLLERKARFYYIKGKEFGALDADRNELLYIINKYDVSESERKRLKMEAGIGDRKLFEDAQILE